MDEERDILVFTDEDGAQIEMEVVDYFDHDGEEYALLVEAAEHDHEEGACCCEEEKDIFIMKVIVDGDTEEFVPVSEDKMEELMQVIHELYEHEDGDEDDDDDCDDECDEEDDGECDDECDEACGEKKE